MKIIKSLLSVMALLFAAQITHAAVQAQSLLASARHIGLCLAQPDTLSGGVAVGRWCSRPATAMTPPNRASAARCCATALRAPASMCRAKARPKAPS